MYELSQVLWLLLGTQWWTRQEEGSASKELTFHWGETKNEQADFRLY